MTASDWDLRELKRRVLDYVSRPDYQPQKPKQIARALGLSAEQTRLLRQAIKQLVAEGQLAYGSGHQVRLPGELAADQVIGVFHRTARGNGYVRPQGVEPDSQRRKDIFVAARNAKDAATGDTVRVKIIRRRGREGKPEGVVLEVLERESHQFVGTYVEEAGQGFVVVDGGMFAHPIPVGDPGAKGARPNDKVVFEMVRFPSYAHPGEGVITEVLGPRGAPGIDTLSVIREFGLVEEFSQAAVAEARRQAERFDESIPPSRRDLTDLTIITIDPEDARDFDDAISLEKLDNGHWLLGVHIADVAHFVREGSALDQEAKDRGTSVYLPDRVIPMLPEIISNSLASLQPNKVRYAKTVFLEYTPEGVLVDVELCRSAIRSVRRFTYEEVDQFLENPQSWRRRLKAAVFHLLENMYELAMILRRRRMARGALELNMPDVRIELDEEGRVVGAHEEPDTASHQIIEEFMLAANEAVANTLHRQGWLFLRRVHFPPSPRKLKALTEFVRELGLKVGSLEDRFELQKLLELVRGRPEERAVHFAVLRSMPQAMYSPTEDGHYALATDCYCHFTSPIRRYPDLTIHRLVDALLAGKNPRNDLGHLMSLGQHCSERERRAEAAERELVKLKLLSFLEEHLGLELEATITGVESYGIFVRGLELPAEGLVHISSLHDDLYKYDRESHALVGLYHGKMLRLGDLVRVKVARVDLERRELDFLLVGRVRRKVSGAKATRARDEALQRLFGAAKRKSKAKKKTKAKKKKKKSKAKGRKRK